MQLYIFSLLLKNRVIKIVISIQTGPKCTVLEPDLAELTLTSSHYITSMISRALFPSKHSTRQICKSTINKQPSVKMECIIDVSSRERRHTPLVCDAICASVLWFGSRTGPCLFVRAFEFLPNLPGSGFHMVAKSHTLTALLQLSMTPECVCENISHALHLAALSDLHSVSSMCSERFFLFLTVNEEIMFWSDTLYVQQHAVQL